jgi:transposase InsO family protein
LGGRGRRHTQQERQVILGLVDEAVHSGARLEKAADILGLCKRTILRWRKHGPQEDKRKGPQTKPAHALTPLEKQKVISIAVSKEMRDLSPKQIVPKLADQGMYIASESSFYRILRERDMQKHRESSQPAVHHKPKEHVATGPNQVWSWDITYLKSPVSGQFYYLYMIMDVWSRFIIQAKVFAEESMEHSSRLITSACLSQGINSEGLILHADNGGPMKGSTMLATLHKLGVVPSFSRPRVSDDNPYSEALFRTVKYRPEFPSKPFQSLACAQQWVDSFVFWYNQKHLHSAIRFITPADRHYGREESILAARRQVYEKARAQNPSRWSKTTRNWESVRVVTLNPDANPLSKAA